MPGRSLGEADLSMESVVGPPDASTHVGLQGSAAVAGAASLSEVCPLPCAGGQWSSGLEGADPQQRDAWGMAEALAATRIGGDERAGDEGCDYPTWAAGNGDELHRGRRNDLAWGLRMLKRRRQQAGLISDTHRAIAELRGERADHVRQMIGPRGGLPKLKTDLIRLAALCNVEVKPDDTSGDAEDPAKAGGGRVQKYRSGAVGGGSEAARSTVDDRVLRSLLGSVTAGGVSGATASEHGSSDGSLRLGASDAHGRGSNGVGGPVVRADIRGVRAGNVRDSWRSVTDVVADTVGRVESAVKSMKSGVKLALRDAALRSWRLQVAVDDLQKAMKTEFYDFLVRLAESDGEPAETLVGEMLLDSSRRTRSSMGLAEYPQMSGVLVTLMVGCAWTTIWRGRGSTPRDRVSNCLALYQ